MSDSFHSQKVETLARARWKEEREVLDRDTVSESSRATHNNANALNNSEWYLKVLFLKMQVYRL